MRRSEAGLTLIELMIPILVASLVAASTFVFFAGQQRIYDTQTKLLNVQQSVTAGMELLTRYVRASGTGMLGCVRPDSDGAGPDPGDGAAPARGVAPLGGPSPSPHRRAPDRPAHLPQRHGRHPHPAALDHQRR